MLKNHMMLDPESKNGSVFDFDGGGNENWYTTSGSPSPQGESKGGFNNYNAYGAQQQDTNSLNSNLFADEDYENEPPLLEELGVNFNHIWSKTQAVMYPVKALNEHILDDADLAGPVCFCLLLGFCLLLNGKVQFGYVYGFSVFGCLGMYGILNLMHPTGLDFWRTCSVLGYCLIPVIALSALDILLDLKGWLGFILASASIIWATGAATRLFNAKLNLAEQYWLVAYPTALMYGCFVIISIF